MPPAPSNPLLLAHSCALTLLQPCSTICGVLSACAPPPPPSSLSSAEQSSCAGGGSGKQEVKRVMSERGKSRTCICKSSRYRKWASSFTRPGCRTRASKQAAETGPCRKEKLWMLCSKEGVPSTPTPANLPSDLHVRKHLITPAERAHAYLSAAAAR